MAYSADWIAKRVTIPVSDLTFVSGSNYTLNIADVHNEMRRMEWDEGLWAINILEHKETLVLSGIPKTRTILVVNGYTWEIAASNIVVSLIGIDSNLMDTFVPANGVSLLANNSVGKQDVVSELSAEESEKLLSLPTAEETAKETLDQALYLIP